MLPYLLLTLATATWGASFVVIKGAVAVFPAASFLFWRFLLAAAALAAYLALRRQFPSRVAWVGGLRMGVFLAAGYGLQTFGLKWTGPSNSGFLTGLYVVLTPLCAWLLWRRRITPRTMLCAAMAVLGLLLLAGSSPGEARLGDLLTLGCALAFAFHFLATERYAPHHDPTALNLVQFIVTFAMFGVGGAITEGLPAPTEAGVIGALLFTALLCTVFGFGCQTWAQARMPATHAALAVSLEAPFAALFARWLGGERLGLIQLSGCALMFAAFLVQAMAAPGIPKDPMREGSNPVPDPGRELV